MTRDQSFWKLAEATACLSPDRRRQVGCVLMSPFGGVLTTGFNAFPSGLDAQADERHLKPAKFEWTEHAERNAIFAAARMGVSTAGAHAFVTMAPCIDCARALIQAGIKRIVCPVPEEGSWYVRQTKARAMLLEAGVSVSWVDEPVI